MDLLILPEIAGEVTVVVVEVKNSEWDAFRADRVKPNLRRHIHQLQDYLDHYVDQIRTGSDQSTDLFANAGQSAAWDAVIGVLLYPRRPHDPDRARLIEGLALEQALTVVWYDETDWRDPETQAPDEPRDGRSELDV